MLNTENETNVIEGNVKLDVIEIENYVYVLEDEKKQRFTLNLEFLDIDAKIQVGDTICMSKELLNRNYDGYSTSYTFGNMESKYGKNGISKDDVDVIKLISGDKEIYLKRLYG